MYPTCSGRSSSPDAPGDQGPESPNIRARPALSKSYTLFFARTHELLQYHFRTVALAFEYDKEGRSRIAECLGGELPILRMESLKRSRNVRGSSVRAMAPFRNHDHTDSGGVIAAPSTFAGLPSHMITNPSPMLGRVWIIFSPHFLGSLDTTITVKAVGNRPMNGFTEPAPTYTRVV
jgi:hypothetical protein